MYHQAEETPASLVPVTPLSSPAAKIDCLAASVVVATVTVNLRSVSSLSLM